MAVGEVPVDGESLLGFVAIADDAEQLLTHIRQPLHTVGPDTELARAIACFTPSVRLDEHTRSVEEQLAFGEAQRCQAGLRRQVVEDVFQLAPRGAADAAKDRIARTRVFERAYGARLDHTVRE